MTSPPRPPSPPSGPPLGTNFSRRKLTHPRPPFPACAKILMRSINTTRNPATVNPMCHLEAPRRLPGHHDSALVGFLARRLPWQQETLGPSNLVAIHILFIVSSLGH